MVFVKAQRFVFADRIEEVLIVVAVRRGEHPRATATGKQGWLNRLRPDFFQHFRRFGKRRFVDQHHVIFTTAPGQRVVVRHPEVDAALVLQDDSTVAARFAFDQRQQGFFQIIENFLLLAVLRGEDTNPATLQSFAARLFEKRCCVGDGDIAQDGGLTPAATASNDVVLVLAAFGPYTRLSGVKLFAEYLRHYSSPSSISSCVG